MQEFNSLKLDYQNVIKKLEDSLITYQNKNYKLELENRDVQQELTALQELLQEVRAINMIQTHKGEYRQMAELEVQVRRGRTRVVNRDDSRDNSKGKQNAFDLVDEERRDEEWNKMMQEIDKMSV